MILIVDDEKYIRSSLTGLLTDEGYDARSVASAEQAEAILRSDSVELILLDIQMSGKDGITFLADNSGALTDIPVIIISGKSDIPTAVMAIKLGGYDFIEKPLNPERVLICVRQALRLSRSLKTEHKLAGHILERFEIIGESHAIRNLNELICKAAQSDATVLITGENGTGKELVANQIHYQSKRKAEPLVTVNCPAIPEHLFESELFGHVRGAFTGAVVDRIGRFETASEGTLFLDEIGDIPLAMQAKLLRVLESGDFEKIGSDSTVHANCRLIAATNRDLTAMMKEGQFRQDLFYRLNVISIAVPPLSKRLDDIPLLTDYFLKLLQADNEYRFSSEAMGLLATFPWPGNIRQLKNFIQQILFTHPPGEIPAEIVDTLYNSPDGPELSLAIDSDNKLAGAIRQFETGFLSDLYRKHEGNIAAMARYLDMDRGNLSKKLKALKIT